MLHTTKSSGNNVNSKEEASKLAAQYARLAFPMMAQHGVDPTPHNYAIWYHYVMSQNKELVKEIDQIIQQQLTFSPDINQYLYSRYVASNVEQKIVEESTASAQTLMAHVLQIIAAFSGETNSFNTQIDDHVKKLTDTLPQAPMQEMVKELINRVKNLRESGSQMQVRLKESTREIESLKKNLDKVAKESRCDFLTGVANRKTFDQSLEEQIKVAKETRTDMCLLMIDIDHFKQFNDKFGHLIGDEVIKTVAKALVDTVRGKDLVARYGGEEFAVILPTTPLQGAQIVSESLRKTIASSDLKRKDTGATIGSITVSIGVAKFDLSRDTGATLIARADEALYRSKKAGRNRVSLENGT